VTNPALTNIVPGDLASRATVVPAMPAALQSQVDTLRLGGTRYPPSYPGDAGMWIPPPPPEFDPAAPDVLAAADLLCQPVSPDVLAAWLTTLSLAIPRAPSAAALANQTGLIRDLCQDIPAGAWCRETLAEAVHTFKQWWPSIGELHELLKPHADRLTGTRYALRRIVAAADQRPVPKPERPPVDEQAMNEVRELLMAFQRERSFNSPDTPDGLTEASRPKARHLSDGALLATHEKLAAEGVPGAQTRAAMLRARLGEKPAPPAGGAPAGNVVPLAKLR
jgi:hypothetical protein